MYNEHFEKEIFNREWMRMDANKKMGDALFYFISFYFILATDVTQRVGFAGPDLVSGRACVGDIQVIRGLTQGQALHVI
jgi:hypothetical protein